MKLTYDPCYNMAHIRFRDARGDVETIRVNDDLLVDLAPDGTLYGLELLNANNPPELHPVFPRLMERFDLSYHVAGLPDKGPFDGTSVIAQLVPDVRPDAIPGWVANAADGDEQRVQLCQIVEVGNGQSATAEGLFYQLIVRLHKFSRGRVNSEESVHHRRTTHHEAPPSRDRRRHSPPTLRGSRLISVRSTPIKLARSEDYA